MCGSIDLKNITLKSECDFRGIENFSSHMARVNDQVFGDSSATVNKPVYSSVGLDSSVETHPLSSLQSEGTNWGDHLQ